MNQHIVFSDYIGNYAAIREDGEGVTIEQLRACGKRITQKAGSLENALDRVFQSGCTNMVQVNGSKFHDITQITRVDQVWNMYGQVNVTYHSYPCSALVTIPFSSNNVNESRLQRLIINSREKYDGYQPRIFVSYGNRIIKNKTPPGLLDEVIAYIESVCDPKIILGEDV